MYRIWVCIRSRFVDANPKRATAGGFKQVESTEPDPPEFIYFLLVLLLALGVVRCRCQLHGEIKEIILLVDEKDRRL
jgi:hypothetical protein